MGADPNAVNDIRRMCARNNFGGILQSLRRKPALRLFVPMLIETFAENGFNVRRHGLKVISELQNGCYDKYMRRAIK